MGMVTAYESTDGSTKLEHLGGVPWHKAPKPRRWHRCKAQTKGWVNYFTLVERCACGAMNIERTGWKNRNERRKRKL